MTYTLTKIRTFIGHEGHGLNATICKDGVPICFVLDDANGGMVELDFRNPKQNAASFQATTNEQAQAAEAAFGAWAMNWYKESGAEAKAREDWAKWNSKMERDFPFTKTAHDAMVCWVNTLADQHANDKRFNRLSKTKTLFRLVGDKPEEWRTFTQPYSDKLGAHIRQKYGDKVEQVWGQPQFNKGV